MSDDALGFGMDDIGKILKDVTKPRRRRRSTTSRSGTDMDAAVRRAVRAELADVGKALKALTLEVAKLRRANEALATKVSKIRG